MSGIGRRRLVQSALGLPALGGLPGATLADTGAALAEPGRGLVLYRQDLPAACQFAERLREAGLQCLALHDDPVRQWRDGLEAEVCAADRILLGLGDWADFMLLRGLAAEQRRFPLLSLQHSQRRQSDADWPRRHAEELLALLRPGDEGRQQALDMLVRRERAAPEAPALFSWLLA